VRILEELEKKEPDLLEYVMETLSGVHLKLLKFATPAKESHRLYLDIKSLVLISIMTIL
jgi:hypothetical protein